MPPCASEDIRPIASREITGHGGLILGMNTRGSGPEGIFVRLVGGAGRGNDR